MECPSAFDPNAGTNRLMESGTSALGDTLCSMLPQSKERGRKEKMNNALEEEFEKTGNGPAYYIMGASPSIPYVYWLEAELVKARAAQSKSAATLNTTSASTPVCPQCKSTDTGYRCCSCGTEFGADDD